MNVLQDIKTVGHTVRPPIWRTVVYCLLGLMGVLVSGAMSPAVWGFRHEPTTLNTIQAVVVLLAAPLFALSLILRHRYPLILPTALAGISTLLPIGNTLTFVAMATMIGRRRGKAVTTVTVFATLVSIAVVFADATANPVGASVIKTMFNSKAADDAAVATPWATAIIFAVLGPVIAIGSGLLVRSARAKTELEEYARAQAAASSRLGDEAARRQERERVAREVHDALGHRLSLLSMHAGAMEAAPGADPKLSQSAHIVRDSAAAAMDDLRSLLSVLNSPDDEQITPVPLSELATVVRESFGAGQQVNSSILISSPDEASPALSRAVYRIVQELLTNARKHAPNAPVWLVVEGGPASGVVVDVRNQFQGGWGGQPVGSSRGLLGITERAELLGGTASYGVEDGDFRVHVELPWHSA